MIVCVSPERHAEVLGQPDEQRGGWTPRSALCSSCAVVPLRQQVLCAPVPGQALRRMRQRWRRGVRGARGKAMADTPLALGVRARVCGGTSRGTDQDDRVPARGGASMHASPGACLVPCIGHPSSPSRSESSPEAPAQMAVRGAASSLPHTRRSHRSAVSCTWPSFAVQPPLLGTIFALSLAQEVLKVCQDAGETGKEYQCD
jgi:hypothetical protein